MIGATISEIIDGLKEKRFSSKELVEKCIAENEKQKDLNCFITIPRDAALAEAEAADKLRSSGRSLPLLGVPIAVKDMILTKGILTTAASKILGNFIPPYDATVVSKLKNAGAIIIGKTNLDEFAMGSSNENSHFGVVRNPWNKACVPGGSSGGSAAAVTAGIVPGALGTDTGGSIRQPASLCGITGIKPTYGRVSRFGVVAFASSLDQVGTFARTAKDCALLTEVISGHDPNDSTSFNSPVPNFSSLTDASINGLRIGVPKEYFIDGVNEEVRKAVEAAISLLVSKGAKRVDISLPNTDAAVAVYYILAPAEASSNLARYDGIRYGHRAAEPRDLKDLYCRTRSEGFGVEVKRRIMLGTYVLSSGYYDAFYLKAQKVRALVKRDFDKAFSESCDVIICPTAPTTAFKIGEKANNPLEMYLNDIFTIPVNLAGLPGMSIPCGFDSGGLPIGLQLIGKPFDEESLFKVATMYQKETDWHLRRPKGGA